MKILDTALNLLVNKILYEIHNSPNLGKEAFVIKYADYVSVSAETMQNGYSGVSY